eukprot:scaffold1320_cov253-Pinguiococcus_pyrenoidosus.AAC.1
MSADEHLTEPGFVTRKLRLVGGNALRDAVAGSLYLKGRDHQARLHVPERLGVVRHQLHDRSRRRRRRSGWCPRLARPRSEVDSPGNPLGRPALHSASEASDSWKVRRRFASEPPTNQLASRLGVPETPRRSSDRPIACSAARVTSPARRCLWSARSRRKLQRPRSVPRRAPGPLRSGQARTRLRRNQEASARPPPC